MLGYSALVKKNGKRTYKQPNKLIFGGIKAPSITLSPLEVLMEESCLRRICCFIDFKKAFICLEP